MKGTSPISINLVIYGAFRGDSYSTSTIGYIYGIPETKRTIRVSVLFVLATYRMISKETRSLQQQVLLRALVSIVILILILIQIFLHRLTTLHTQVTMA